MPVTLQRVDQTLWNSDPRVRSDLLRLYEDAPAERLGQTPETFLLAHLETPAHELCCAHFHGHLLAAVAVRRSADAWWLDNLCVRRTMRRQGIGTQLLTLTHQAARQSGCQLRVVGTRLTMADQMLLKRLGYRLTQAGDYFALDLPPKGAGP